MKKTMKLVSVLAIMLALIISCAPGPDTKPNQNGNGSDTVAPDKPSEGGSSEEGTINPNIPPASSDDISEIIPQIDPEIQSEILPPFSNKHLLVNADKAVQDKFVDDFLNSPLGQQFKEASEISHSVEGNKFVVKIVWDNGEQHGVYFLTQNGNDGNWYMEMHDVTEAPDKKTTDVSYMALSGQMIFPDKVAGIKDLPNGKIIHSAFYYEEGSEDKYEGNVLIECDRAAFDAFVKANNLEETKDKHNPSKISYVLMDDKNNSYASAEFRDARPFTTSGMILYYTTDKNGFYY